MWITSLSEGKNVARNARRYLLKQSAKAPRVDVFVRDSPDENGNDGSVTVEEIQEEEAEFEVHASSGSLRLLGNKSMRRRDRKEG